jgi:lysozyme family protein
MTAQTPVQRAIAAEDAGKPRSGRKAIPAACCAMIAATIAIEGGYVNHPADPGGETNMGVTKVVARKHGYDGPMRTLPREVAESVYYEQYIVAPGLEPLIAIDAPVTEELYDTGVNMGTTKPARWFQQSIGELCGTRIVPDGKVGPGTIAAYAACQQKQGATPMCVSMLNKLDGKQKAEYERLVSVNPKLRVFLRGWIANRVGNVDRRKCGKATK